MKQTVIENIRNMESYLVTPKAWHPKNDLWEMNIAALWLIHDNLVTLLKSTLD